MVQEQLEILDYHPGHQPFFEELNRSWIEASFRMEPVDEFVLVHPEEAILDPGGAILMAVIGGRVIGTVALKKQSPAVYELTKMTISGEYRGRGFGENLCAAAIRKARDLGASKLVLYSNRILKPAIQLYHKLGFREAPIEPQTYERCDIKMDIVFNIPHVRLAHANDAETISAIGRESFHRAFSPFFRHQEDLLNYLDHTYDPGKLRQSMAKPNNVFFLAFHKQEPAGFMKIKIQSPQPLLPGNRHMELQKIYVLQNFHGSPVAPALFRSARELAQKWEPSHIWLDVLVENKKAIRFYEMNGFSNIGERSFRIGSQVFDYNIMGLPVEFISQMQKTGRSNLRIHNIS